MSEPGVFELHFPMTGKMIVPRDNRYCGFSAVSALLGDETTHNNRNFGLHSLKGTVLDDKTIFLNENHTLKIRVGQDASLLAQLYKLAGKTLTMDGYRNVLGIPTFHHIEPSSSLYIDCVYFNAGKYIGGENQPARLTPQIFQTILQDVINYRKLPLTLDQVEIVHPVKFRVKTAVLNGYQVNIFDLTTEAAEYILSHGLGGKQSMGCGLPVPWRLL